MPSSVKDLHGDELAQHTRHRRRADNRLVERQADKIGFDVLDFHYLDVRQLTRNFSSSFASGSQPSPGPCGSRIWPSTGSYQFPSGLSERSQ